MVNNEDVSPEIVLFAGDWHANRMWATESIEIAHAKGATAIVHVGDFGLYPQQVERFLKPVHQKLTQLGMKLYFVDGNHENFEYLYSFPIQGDGFRKITNTIYHIPRGHVWEWQGKRLLGLGGAHSIDKQIKILMNSWFVEEKITESDVDKAIKNGAGNIDIMVSHDTPVGVNIPLSSMAISEIDLYESYDNRKLLGEAVKAIQPKKLIHGHYHVYYEDTTADKNTQVIGLDRDGSTFRWNRHIIDLRTMEELD